MQPLVAVGALGGSGTRVIAQILINLGINLGGVLNEPNDNLIFTALFKSPKWYKLSHQKEFKSRLRIFDRFMNGQTLSATDNYTLLKASLTNKTIGRDYLYYYKVFLRRRSIRASVPWGWKEPNTQLYLEEINDLYPQIKYVHVLRNGLDMAFSSNKYQLKNWGFKYDIFINDTENNQEISIKQLDYWIESTKEVLSKRSKFQDRFYLLNYTNFCLDPSKEIDKLLRFLDLNINHKELTELTELVRITKSFDRYKQKDISFFRKDQLDFVKQMGFL